MTGSRAAIRHHLNPFLRHVLILVALTGNNHFYITIICIIIIIIIIIIVIVYSSGVKRKGVIRESGAAAHGIYG